MSIVTSDEWRGKDEWRDKLQDIDFWMNGYRQTGTYRHWNLGGPILLATSSVSWNIGVEPMLSFTRAITSIIVEKCNSDAEYDHVIEMDLSAPKTREAIENMNLRLQEVMAIMVAKELGLLDEEYDRWKKNYEEEQYYSYNSKKDYYELNTSYYIWKKVVPRIIKKMSTKRYLLVVENLPNPITPVSFIVNIGLPPPGWTDSRWFISTTSRDVFKNSHTEQDRAPIIDNKVKVLVLTLHALNQSSKHIFNMIRQESEVYWHHIAISCFHYAMMIFAKHTRAATSENELIHQWAAQGILPQMNMNEEETTSYNSKCAHMHQIGKVILQAFKEYSILQLPFSPSHEAHESTQTAAHFLAYHDLIAEEITIDEISENKKKWISFVDDHGWHVSREWLSQYDTCTGTTTLILRGCSHQSLILSKLDHFLPILFFLRVLDLSYTTITTLLSSIGCLSNLRLLSLRGCHDLKTLFSSSISSTTCSIGNANSYSPLSTLFQLEILDMNGAPISHLTQDIFNQKSNLIYLDMSHSKVTTFPHNFFQNMPNLEELILVSCSSLVDLPPSIATLSSLTTLEVTGTQIKYFPKKIFEEMHKLQSLKLIDNKKLISFPRSISRAHGLIHLHIEGWESVMVEVIKLEGLPNLKSFLLIGVPHIRCLSLRRCRKLESVELKNLGTLEELDLSATSIKELPADIHNHPQLRSLLLMGVPSLRRFPWHKLERLPRRFFLDHFAEENSNHHGEMSRVCVNDSRFFWAFDERATNLVRNGRFFQIFYVRVTPCLTNSMQLTQDEEGMLDNMLQDLVQTQSIYQDVYSSICIKEEIEIESPITAPLLRTDRHVEISGMQRTSDGLCDLLNVTRSISVTCDSSISKLYDLSSFDELEECELRWCHKMEGVFSGEHDLENLRNVHVSNLKSLHYFCRTYRCFVAAFSSLQHLHLEDCPRLEYMCSAITLPHLKTLDILFCYNLKMIFYAQDGQSGTCQYPNLQRVRLQELPHLQHIHDNNATIMAPMWKKLHVRGCWSLRYLPRLQEDHTSKPMKVNGERSWWQNLCWESPLHHDSYEPNLPQEFASFNKDAKITSYLR